MYKIYYKLLLLIKRIIHYDKPLRIALLGYLSLKFKTFKPHYESVLYEGCLEAKKLGIDRVTALELGVHTFQSHATSGTNHNFHGCEIVTPIHTS